MKHKHSANSLVSLIVICAMIASLFCIGGLSASADDTTATTYPDSSKVVDLSGFANTNAKVETNDPSGDGICTSITTYAGKNGTASPTITNDVLGLETGKSYVFSCYVKGGTLTSGNIWFETYNSDSTATDKVILNLKGTWSDWTKIESVLVNTTYSNEYLTMDETVKAAIWVKNDNTTDVVVSIDALVVAEYDVEAGAIVEGSEKVIDLKKFEKEATAGKTEQTTVVNDMDTDSDNQKLAVTIAGSTNSASLKAITVNGLTVGKKYQFSFYVKGDAFANANMWIKHNSSDKSNLALVNFYSGYADWTKLTSSVFAASAESVVFNLWFNNSKSETASTLYFDHMVIKEVTNAVSLTSYEAPLGDNGTAEIVAGGLDSDNEQLKVTVNAGVSAGKGVNFDGFNPGALYNVKMYVKGSDFYSGNIYVNSPKAENDEIKYKVSYITDPDDWQEVKFENIAANTNGVIQIGFWLNNSKDTDNAKYLYIDEITVTAQKTFDMEGASIRTETENQDLKFNIGLSTDGVVAENWNITEYGMIFTPAQRFSALGITDVSELTLELAEQYPNYIIVSSQEVADGTLPATADFTLNGSSSTPILNGGSSCGVKICARAYYKYSYSTTSSDTVEGIIYSNNTLAADDTTTGSVVESGVATRSVYGIAKAMAAKLFETEDITLAEGTKVQSYTDGVFYDASGTAVANADILAFVVANLDAVNQIVGG